MCLVTGLTPKCHFVSGLSNESPEIPKIRLSRFWKAHSFVQRPSIEVRYKAKLYPSLKTFQWYVARHVQERNFKRFPTFLSFDRNLCFKWWNGSCDFILNIYNPRVFQWPLQYNWFWPPAITLQKFKNPLRLQLPKWEFIWECEGSILHTLSHSHEHEM
jgi:hypothetical protein